MKERNAMSFYRDFRSIKGMLQEIKSEIAECRKAYQIEKVNDAESEQLLIKLDETVTSFIQQIDRLTQVEYGDYSNMVEFLNHALKLEYNAIFNYQQYARAIKDSEVAAHLYKFGAMELEHSRQIARLIRKLGGIPKFNPPAPCCDKTMTLKAMLEEHYQGEQAAIRLYEEGLNYYTDQEFAYEIGKIRLDELDHLKDLKLLITEFEQSELVVHLKSEWRDNYAGDDKDRPWIDG
jgi:bacterioferritin (cytochrome b1)